MCEAVRSEQWKHGRRWQGRKKDGTMQGGSKCSPPAWCTFHTQLPKASHHRIGLPPLLLACPLFVLASSDGLLPARWELQGSSRAMGKRRRQGPVVALSPSRDSSTRAALSPGTPACMPFTKRRWSVSRECQSAQAVCSPAVLGPRGESVWFCGLAWILVVWTSARQWLHGEMAFPRRVLCPAVFPPQLLREPFTQYPFSSLLSGNISRPCTERTSLSSLCFCTETQGTLEGKNICSSFRHCSPFSLAGRGEGWHYFTDESGKSSMFAVSNASKTIIVGLNLEFGNARQLWFGGRVRKKKKEQ